jgi:protein ImuA
VRPQPAIDALRAQIEKIEGHRRRVRAVLPFGLAEVDSRLPGQGLARGALQEIAGDCHCVLDGAAAALCSAFSAASSARAKWRIWAPIT